MMERKEITAFLSEQLIQDKLAGNGKYWAREVCLDWGTKDVRRVDFMEFCPTGVLSVSEIEKGIFVSYEVKSCMADYKSGFGQNFVTEKNYLVMPMELYKKVVQDIEGSVGVICPVPEERDVREEFQSPTALDTEGVKWRMRVVLPCLTGARKRSMVELLFCMLRAGK